MKKEKQQIFEKEELILREAQNILESSDEMPTEQLKKNYKALAESYEQLLGEVRLLTSVSDRFQLKLNKANESIEKKNSELKLTSEEFTSTKAAQEVAYVMLVIVCFLFLVTEGLFDPFLLNGFNLYLIPIDETDPDKYRTLNPNGFVTTFVIKVLIILALIPLRKFVGKVLSKTQAVKQQNVK